MLPGMVSPFLGGVIGMVDVLAFRRAMPIPQGLNMSPRIAPATRAKLCTCFRWFARPDRVLVEPYCELALFSTKFRLVIHFMGGFHVSPIEKAGLQDQVFQDIHIGAQFAHGVSGDELHCAYSLCFARPSLSFGRLSGRC